MSFTRLIYDTKAYETDLQQNMAPIYYTLNPVKNKHENKEVVYKPGFNISHPPVISKFNNPLPTKFSTCTKKSVLCLSFEL